MIVIRLVGVQLSEAMAMPRLAGDVSASHEIIAKDGQVSAGDVLSSTTIFCIQVAEKPHWSEAVHVLLMVPVPIQPVSRLVLSE